MAVKTEDIYREELCREVQLDRRSNSKWEISSCSDVAPRRDMSPP